MKLYHGTSVESIPRILKHGIKPRKPNKKSNWKEFPSKPGYVYLTVAYALYFAVHAAPEDSMQCAIVEIDGLQLDEAQLCPDEDFIAQALLHHGQAKTLAITHTIDPMKYQHHWLDSLNGLGNCCYHGTIPPESITRIAIIDLKENVILAAISLDPSISLLNYKFMSKKYHSVMSYIFDGAEIFDDLLDNPGLQQAQEPLGHFDEFFAHARKSREQLKVDREKSIQIYTPSTYCQNEQ